MALKIPKDLLIEWEQKLKESGFKDSETKGYLKQYAKNSYNNQDQTSREARLNYYIKIGQSLSTLLRNDQFDFFNYCEQLIMFLHSEGLCIEEIVRHLDVIGLSKNRKTVRYIIRRWQATWKIRSWSLKEMRLKRKRAI